MTPQELCKKLGGEITLNRMKAVVDGKLQIIARLEGDEYKLSDVGARVAAKFNAEKTVGLAEEKPKKRATKPKVEKAPEAPSEPAKGLFDLPIDE